MQMKKTTTISILILALLVMPVAAYANQATFDAKCKACHGADGKKLAKADLTSDAIQGKTDADLVKFLTTDASTEQSRGRSGGERARRVPQDAQEIALSVVGSDPNHTWERR
jgi:mono/diheme cytochrome c family protein